MGMQGGRWYSEGPGVKWSFLWPGRQKGVNKDVSCAQLSGSALRQVHRGPHSQVQVGHHLFLEAFTSFSFCWCCVKDRVVLNIAEAPDRAAVFKVQWAQCMTERNTIPRLSYRILNGQFNRIRKPISCLPWVNLYLGHHEWCAVMAIERVIGS